MPVYCSSTSSPSSNHIGRPTLLFEFRLAAPAQSDLSFPSSSPLPLLKGHTFLFRSPDAFRVGGVFLLGFLGCVFGGFCLFFFFGFFSREASRMSFNTLA